MDIEDVVVPTLGKASENMNPSLFSTFYALFLHFFALFAQYTNTKALSKQERTKICWDARFFNRFFEFVSAVCCKKKDSKNEHPIKSLALLILLWL